MNYYHCCCFSVIVCSLVFLMMMLMMIMIQTILDRLDGIICIYIFICSETIVKLDSFLRNKSSSKKTFLTECKIFVTPPITFSKIADVAKEISIEKKKKVLIYNLYHLAVYTI